jgi:dipeptidyl aminopeptidase/acylaminoacyl peptidase
MNNDEVRLTDEILDVIFEKYGLDESTPIISTGGSMGGLACIVYTKYAKRTPVACVSNCPVCDLPFHYTERVDLPRTLYSAFYSYDCTLEEALLQNSPLHLASTLPKKTEYVVFHCEKDSMVNIHAHSDKFVNELSKYRAVEYHIVPDKDHCCFDAETTKQFRDTAISFIEKNS